MSKGTSFWDRALCANAVKIISKTNLEHLSKSQILGKRDVAVMIMDQLAKSLKIRNPQDQ